MKKLAVLLIGLYQKLLSFETGVLTFPFRAKICRFTPRCSDYAIGAINKYGLVKGGFLSLKRILRCGPWTKGGHDPVI